MVAREGPHGCAFSRRWSVPVLLLSNRMDSTRPPNRILWYSESPQTGPHAHELNANTESVMRLLGQKKIRVGVLSPFLDHHMDSFTHHSECTLNGCPPYVPQGSPYSHVTLDTWHMRIQKRQARHARHGVERRWKQLCSRIPSLRRKKFGKSNPVQRMFEHGAETRSFLQQVFTMVKAGNYRA